MPKINPPAGLFLAIATLSAGTFVRLRAYIARVKAGPSAANARTARIAGAVADALGRPFPERMARAPGAEDGAGG